MGYQMGYLIHLNLSHFSMVKNVLNASWRKSDSLTYHFIYNFSAQSPIYPMPKFCLYIFIYLMHLVVSFPCVNFPVVFHGYKTNNGHFCSKKHPLSIKPTLLKLNFKFTINLISKVYEQSNGNANRNATYILFCLLPP